MSRLPHRPRCLALIASVAALGMPAAAFAGGMELSYSVTVLGTLPGAEFARGYGLNNRGQVVGESGGRPFLWDNGVMTPLDTGGQGIPRRINDAGQLGFGAIDPRLPQAMPNVGLPSGANSAVATGMNESGQIIGDLQLPALQPGQSNDGRIHAFLYSNGQYTDLGSGGWPTGSAGPFSHAVAINSFGQVLVENCTPGSSIIRQGFLYQNGQMTALPALNLFGFDGINDSGQILAHGPYFGITHAFLLTPNTVPEPSPIAFAGVLVTFLGFLRRRHRAGCNA